MKHEITRVCLPETISVETLARLVVSDLRKQPTLKRNDAAYAATGILPHTNEFISKATCSSVGRREYVPHGTFSTALRSHLIPVA
jgi:hypothetical protein